MRTRVVLMHIKEALGTEGILKIIEHHFDTMDKKWKRFLEKANGEQMKGGAVLRCPDLTPDDFCNYKISCFSDSERFVWSSHPEHFGIS